MLIEKVSNKIQKEARKEKRIAMKLLFLNALLNGINTDSYSIYEFYLEALDSLSDIDLRIFALIYQEDRLMEIKKINIKIYKDPYFTLASVNRLRNYGFVEIYSGDIHLGAKDNALNERVKASSLGKDFAVFCLT